MDYVRAVKGTSDRARSLPFSESKVEKRRFELLKGGGRETTGREQKGDQVVEIAIKHLFSSKDWKPLPSVESKSDFLWRAQICSCLFLP